MRIYARMVIVVVMVIIMIMQSMDELTLQRTAERASALKKHENSKDERKRQLTELAEAHAARMAENRALMATAQLQKAQLERGNISLLTTDAGMITVIILSLLHLHRLRIAVIYSTTSATTMLRSLTSSS